MKIASLRSVAVAGVMLALIVFAGCDRSKIAPNDLPRKPLNTKVAKKLSGFLINHMSLSEKIDLLGGTGFATKGNQRRSIVPLRMSDGPLGMRWGRSTAFPAGIAMASSWDTSLVGQIGEGIGREVRGKARDIILGPNVNIARNPLNGRTFEAFGEDPVLTSAMGVSYIEGVQRQGVGATVKHFVANNQEYHRMFVDAHVDSRTLHEIYFPAFKAAVQKAHVWAVMASYNKINGEYATANHYLLTQILKKDWGFNGLVMSDWGAVHSTIPVVNSGLDLEMPTGYYLNEHTLMPAVKAGQVTDSTINDHVRRILRTQYRLGKLLHNVREERLVDTLINTRINRHIALQAAREGIVLLKNDNMLLPLDASGIKSVAVIGPDAATARVVGGGSAGTHPVFTVSPLQALNSRLKGKVAIQYVPGVLFDAMQPVDSAYFFHPDGKTPGLRTEYYDNTQFSGHPIIRTTGQLDFRQGASQQTPIGKYPELANGYSIRFTGKLLAPVTGTYEISLRGGRMEAYLDHKPLPAGYRGSGGYKVNLEAGRKYDLEIDYIGSGYNPDDGNSLRLQLEWKRPNRASIDNAVAAARQADVAIVFAGTSAEFESEGRDRKSLELPDNQDDLIGQVARANKRTIVVLTTGAPVLVNKWIGQVPAVLESWFDGEEIGNAIADVLLGNYNPSGKLPVTFPKRWEDEPPSVQNYISQDTVSDYSEGIFVGYRYFDQHHIEPQFPFGYGLSYTTFAMSKLQIQDHSTAGSPSVDVSFAVTNTGKKAGAEVAQLYVGEQSPRLPRPVKELKDFARVDLKPGESKTVHFTLDKSAFAYYDPARSGWVADPGIFNILVGNSSRNIELTGQVTLK